MVLLIIRMGVITCHRRNETSLRLRSRRPRTNGTRNGTSSSLLGSRASLACVLGDEGRKVLCVERDATTPERIVGELLQPGGYKKLKELGLESCVENIDAQKVYGYTMYKDGEEATMMYPLDEQSLNDDIAGRSFHNWRFVQQLRRKAYGNKNVTLREGTVKFLVKENGETWNDKANDGGVAGIAYDIGGDEWVNGQLVAGKEKPKRFTSYAPLTIVCDRHFSSLRKKLADNKIDHPSHFVGLILDGAPSEILGENANQGHVVWEIHLRFCSTRSPRKKFGVWWIFLHT